MDCDSGAAAYEFFSGGGMARLGLGPAWTVTFANDHDPVKTALYTSLFGASALRCGDIGEVGPGDLPGRADLAWASSPCQDLSLAGARQGLTAPRSGAFWAFWRLMEALGVEGRAPNVIVLENVRGLLTSRRGADFAAIAAAFAAAGYFVGALEIDAAHFVPQSRPRIFIVAAKSGLHLAAASPASPFHSEAIQDAARALAREAKQRWVWWRLAAPPLRNTALRDLIDPLAPGDPALAARLLALMSERQRAAVAQLASTGVPTVGAVFRRVRTEAGRRVQRAEARFDGLAGCLRTPAGGSSRQFLLFIEGERAAARLLTARESARLMGLPADYPLPQSESRALHLVGDGVCVPAVRWLSEQLLQPLAAACRRPGGAAL